MTARIALVWSEGNGGHPELVTDHCNLAVYSVDERHPDDRVYRYGSSVRRVTPEVFDQLIAGAVHQAGDKPIVEQAVRAMLANGTDGRPHLAIVAGSIVGTPIEAGTITASKIEAGSIAPAEHDDG